MRDVAGDLARDLGGADYLSEQQLSLVRRAATLTVQLEQLAFFVQTHDPVALPRG